MLWRQPDTTKDKKIDAAAAFTRGVRAHRNGNLKEALDAYDSAIQASDDPPASYFHNRGGALAVLGDNEQALASFRQAVNIDPKHSGALKNLGAILVKQRGHEAEAAQIFERILDLDRAPNSRSVAHAIFAYRNHAAVLAPEDACKVLEKAAELSAGRDEHAEVLPGGGNARGCREGRNPNNYP